MSTVNFKINNSRSYEFDATADFTTDALKLKNSAWSVSFTHLGSVGNSRYTIEVSNDGTKWDNWSNDSSNRACDDPFYDEIFPFKYIRVQYDAGNATGILNLWINFE